MPAEWRDLLCDPQTSGGLLLATLVVLCSAGASYYMTFMNVVIGYGIIASVIDVTSCLSVLVIPAYRL
jgi:glucan phosphoethanolaminetransferase (alkaline phosphatase superfamily)